MGRQEGPGCYCYVNNLLRTVVDSISTKYNHIVIDNEAGMEHLSRRTTRSTDVLFVVVDMSKAALEAAKRISVLADEMKLEIGRKGLVFNLSDPSSDGPPVEHVDGFDTVYSVRRSARISSESQRSESLMDLPTIDPAFSDIGKAIDSERRVV
jgi:CO dehydrogenase maturation factor